MNAGWLWVASFKLQDAEVYSEHRASIAYNSLCFYFTYSSLSQLCIVLIGDGERLV